MRSPIKVLANSLTIAWKDLVEFKRSRIALVFSFLFPLMIIAMFGYMFPGSANTVHDVPVGLVVEDNGPYAQNVTDVFRMACSNSSMFNLVNVSSTDQAKDKILAGEIKGAVIIPSNFTDSLLNMTQAKTVILTDPSNPGLTAAITQYFTGITRAISDQFAKEMIESGMSMNSSFVLQPITVGVEGIVSGGGSSFDFVAPGFIAMTVMMSGLTAVGAAITREREVGTLDGFLMCPISRTSIILGKMISRTTRNLLQGAIVIGLAIFLFGIHVRGNPILIALVLLLGTLSFMGLGIIATVAAKEQESAQLILGLLQFPMMFLSGLFFPVEQMPVPLQWVSRVLPLTYAANALRKVMILGVGIGGIVFELTILVILGLVTILLGVPLFDRAVRK